MGRGECKSTTLIVKQRESLSLRALAVKADVKNRKTRRTSVIDFWQWKTFWVAVCVCVCVCVYVYEC